MNALTARTHAWSYCIAEWINEQTTQWMDEWADWNGLGMAVDEGRMQLPETALHGRVGALSIFL